MEDNQLDKLTVPMSPEQIRKIDADLLTISLLTSFVESAGSTLVLTGGYATEALCGGRITRPHGDIDAHIIIGSSQDANSLLPSVKDKVISEKEVNWKVERQTADKIELVEDEEVKSYFNKRRLELSMHQPNDDLPGYVSAILINSRGEEIGVNVVEINELVAIKIHKFYLVKDGVDTSKDRHTDDRDTYDLKRLLGLESCDKLRVLDILVKRYLSDNGSYNASRQAEDEYDYAVGLLNRN